MSTLLMVDHFICDGEAPIVSIQLDSSRLVKDGEGFWLEVRLHARQPQVYEAPEVAYNGALQAQWTGPHSERCKDAS
jgi:hypothetical protein